MPAGDGKIKKRGIGLQFTTRVILALGIAGLPITAGAMAAQSSPATEAKTGQAHVVVYRVSRYRDPKIIKPSIYCDGKEVALMYSGRFFTVNLSPGKHTITSSDEHTSVSLDAESGATYYVRIAVVKGVWVNNTFSVHQVDRTEASPELARLTPADAKHVTNPDLVSIEAIPAQ
jgi:hypothetical protein